MSSVVKVLTGIGILIAIFLFLRNGDQTVKIISTLAYNTTAGIKTLQGR